MKRIRKYILTTFVLLACSVAAQAQSSTVATAKQVNGTYRDVSGSEFKILALGNNLLRVEFNGIYPYKSPQGMTANTGEASGEAKIEGNIAEFIPKDMEQCRITLKFLPGKLVVSQHGTDGECGFGHNVSASGTYTKRSSTNRRTKRVRGRD